MARYVDADAAIELLKSLGSRDYRREKGTICDAIKMLHYPEYTPTADVVPRADYDAVIEGQLTLQKHLANVRQEVAREIFEEIEEFMIDDTLYKIPSKVMLSSKFAELKKKYTEEGG